MSNKIANKLSQSLGLTSIAILCNLVSAQAIFAQGAELLTMPESDFSTSQSIQQQQRPEQRLEQQPEQQEEESSPSSQIIRIKLDLDGPNLEWVRIETQDNGNGETQLTAYHTKRVKDELLSTVVSLGVSTGAETLVQDAIDGYEGPVPTPDINFWNWRDHETRQIMFTPQGCSDRSCSIRGTNSITLPQGTDIRAGSLMIEYQERDLIRSVTLRIPEEEE